MSDTANTTATTNPEKSEDYYFYSISENEKDPLAAKHSKNGKYKGLVEKRRSTDLLCLLLIIAMWATMTVVGSVATMKGNIFRLIGPISSTGSICGFDGSVKNEAYFYTVLTNGLGSCIHSCPNYNAPLNSTSSTDYVCLFEVYSSFGVSPYTESTDIDNYIQQYCLTGPQNTYNIDSNCGCNIIRATHNQFRRCRFNDQSIANEYLPFREPSFFSAFIANVVKGRIVIFAFGFLSAVILSFMITLILRYECLGFIFLWSSIFTVLLFMVAMTVLCYRMANTWTNQHPRVHDETSIHALRAFSIVMCVLSFFYVCVMIFLRKTIDVGIRVVSLAARAIDDMPFIVFSPLIQLTGFVMFFVPFIFYCFYIASEGSFTDVYGIDPLNPSSSIVIGKYYHLAPGQGERLWFMFFCLLWSMNFICAIGSMAVAYCIASWYFTPPNERAKKFGSGHVFDSYLTVLRYHLGTIAFGSLIIAFVQLIKYFAIYVQKHYQSIKNHRILKYTLYVVTCLIVCLEKCLKYLSKNAYIQTSIHGTSFIVAAKDAFFTIARNLFLIGGVSMISHTGLIIMKVFVCGVVTASAYIFFDSVYYNIMTDFIGPTFLVLVISWITVTIFMDIFQMCIDTILMCYITDLEDNDGKEAIFADPHMKAFVEKHGKLEISKPQKEAVSIVPGAPSTL